MLPSQDAERSLQPQIEATTKMWQNNTNHASFFLPPNQARGTARPTGCVQKKKKTNCIHAYNTTACTLPGSFRTSRVSSAPYVLSLAPPSSFDRVVRGADIYEYRLILVGGKRVKTWCQQAVSLVTTAHQPSLGLGLGLGLGWA